MHVMSREANVYDGIAVKPATGTAGPEVISLLLYFLLYTMTNFTSTMYFKLDADSYSTALA